jgi:hypothetical protein
MSSPESARFTLDCDDRHVAISSFSGRSVAAAGSLHSEQNFSKQDRDYGSKLQAIQKGRV